MAELLLEIGTEELPVGEQRAVRSQLPELMTKALRDLRLTWDGMDVFSTPRRGAVRVTGLADKQPDLSEVVTGPPVKVAFDAEGKPTKAAVGFAKKVGVSVDELEVLETERGKYVGCKVEEAGRAAEEVLPSALEGVIGGLKFRKVMRWGAGKTAFSRPVRWIVALLDERVLPVRFAGQEASNQTQGHRFNDPGPHALSNPAVYERVLERAGVVADADERSRRIEQGLDRVDEELASRGWKVRRDEELLVETTGLVEWPVIVVGSFDEAFLDVPPEVLVTAMKTHQRFFALEDGEGNLAPGFVGIAGTRVRDEALVRDGMERVLRARLADARFFWEEDLKVPLADFAAQLVDAMFQSKLGTVLDKVRRVEKIAVGLADVFGVDSERARTAAALCKADLMSQMVGEFPELQGVMGREYARRQGLGEDLALAIWEHYLPRSAGDDLPETKLGALLSVADRIDTITGCFGAGLKPKGSGDPFALRRAALGLLRILLDRRLAVDLGRLVDLAAETLPENLRPDGSEVVSFLLDRLKSLLAEKASGDVVRAVLLAGGSDPVDLGRRVDAVVALQGRQVFATLGQAFRRTVNIFKQAGDQGQAASLDSAALVEPEEKALHSAFQDVEKRSAAFLASGEYEKALEVMAELAGPIDLFFDNVRVFDSDEKLSVNRLALLRLVDALFRRVADFKVMATKSG